MISEVGYGPRASDTWRWVDEPADVPVGAFVGQLAGRDPANLQPLSAEDQFTLVRYAQRCAFAALRHRDPGLVRNATIAASLVTEAAMGDDRGIWTLVELICYAHHRVGGLTGAKDWIARADRVVREAFAFILNRPGEEFDHSDPGIREMVTRAGLVLLDDGHGSFAPTADLVDMAYRVAEVLEADRYHVESIEVADDFWLFPWDHVGDTEVVEVNRRQVAAVNVRAIVDGERFQPIEVFIVEYPGEQDAALVAAAADRWDHDEEIQIAVAKGKILMVLCIRYRDEPYTETLAELERFRSGLQASL